MFSLGAWFNSSILYCPSRPLITEPLCKILVCFLISSTKKCSLLKISTTITRVWTICFWRITKQLSWRNATFHKTRTLKRFFLKNQYPQLNNVQITFIPHQSLIFSLKLHSKNNQTQPPLMKSSSCGNDANWCVNNLLKSNNLWQKKKSNKCATLSCTIKMESSILLFASLPFTKASPRSFSWKSTNFKTFWKWIFKSSKKINSKLWKTW